MPKKIQDFLIDNGFSCEVKELPDSTRTAEEAARAIGCEVAQIAKSLIFIDKASGNPILVIASGANQVDIKKLEQSIRFNPLAFAQTYFAIQTRKMEELPQHIVLLPA